MAALRPWEPVVSVRVGFPLPARKRLFYCKGGAFSRRHYCRFSSAECIHSDHDCRRFRVGHYYGQSSDQYVRGLHPGRHRLPVHPQGSQDRLTDEKGGTGFPGPPDPIGGIYDFFYSVLRGTVQ